MKKRQEPLDMLPPIAPLEFFELAFDLTIGKRHRLPDTSDLLGEESFATVYLTWNMSRFQIEVQCKQTFEESFYPEYRKGDSVEIFIDTRDRKKPNYPTRFCHHFIFLPTPVQGIQALEVSKFRAEDSHPHCDPDLLHIKAERKKLCIDIETAALHGFDATAFNRLGFSYRINRFGEEPEHFSLKEWATFNLIGAK